MKYGVAIQGRHLDSRDYNKILSRNKLRILEAGHSDRNYLFNLIWLNNYTNVRYNYTKNA